MASKFHCTRACLPYMIVFALMLMGYTMGDSAEEKQKCAEQLTGIATCLPYVGGDAKAPSPDCCNGLKQALKNNKKCICIIIKDRDDPDLGLKINITLAIGLPSLCKAPDNLSQCPSLLHLDPKSAEAQAFNQLGENSNNGSSSSPTPSPAAEENSPSGKGKGTDAGATGTSNPAKSEACYEGKRLLKSLVAGVLIWFL